MDEATLNVIMVTVVASDDSSYGEKAVVVGAFVVLMVYYVVLAWVMGFDACFVGSMALVMVASSEVHYVLFDPPFVSNLIDWPSYWTLVPADQIAPGSNYYSPSY